MASQDEQNRYVLETWSAVQTLWDLFDEKAQEAIASTHPHIPASIIEGMRKRGPEAAALQIVVQVVTDDIAHAFTAEAKKEALAELNDLMQMNFDEAQGYMTTPFIHTLVNAWQVVRKWIDEGKVDAAASEFLLGNIVGALTSGPPPKGALPASRDRHRRMSPPDEAKGEPAPATSSEMSKKAPLRTVLLVLGIVGLIILVGVYIRSYGP